jgi:pyrroloquinoline-quinone synthase
MSTVTLSTFDPAIASRSLLIHPFYQAWTKGELTLDQLRIYAKEYFALVQEIPGLVEDILLNAQREKSPLVTQIEQNRLEEIEHIGLWKRFAMSLGVAESELHAYQPTQKTQQILDKLHNLCRKSLTSGVAAMYALERELPEIARTKKQGLMNFYGLSTPDAMAYFDEHEGEEKHLEVWRKLAVEQGEAAEAVDGSMEGQNGILDAVCEASGIGMEC